MIFSVQLFIYFFLFNFSPPSDAEDFEEERREYKLALSIQIVFERFDSGVMRQL